ncbi:hypothetical protein CHU92_13815 [Flavobacterium cyanobacteriorum]|uniref:HTH araC/xylS-type domain-containing protein n=1 Tax=Flavobacterium cyanobacteriorum TaxID=2022802 RepID=A0A255YWC9_9FLAO|nr:AraC family transcriptional regulator [Flavobacterium cyanobacteriorum]OYQ32994.1 hypothetical protein CHU92_13815 [Flavobacterium cyanobacteriorum]
MKSHNTKTNNISQRKKEIATKFLHELSLHMADLENGYVNDKYTIENFASVLCVHPVHLTSTIKTVTGQTPCELYKEALIAVSKKMLLSGQLTVSEIASRLTFDASNFSKFFKKATGQPPSAFKKKT